MRRWGRVGLMIAALIMGLAGGLWAQETKTVQGDVVDPALYLREGRHGKDVEDLIYDAVDGGQSLALLEAGTGLLWLLLATEPGADPNELVYEYAGRSIQATGTIHERGGLRGIVVTSVEPREGPALGIPTDVEP